MAYESITKVEEAISKYGGGDAVYEQKLKTHFKGLLGYDNYMSRLNKTASAPLKIPIKGNLTPAAIKSLSAGAIGMKQEEMGAIGDMAGRIDQVAGGLASDQAQRERAASRAADNAGLDFKPTNWVESEALNYVKNATPGEDGKYESRDEMIKRLEKQLIGEGGDVNAAGGVTSENIRAMIDKVVPADIEERRAFYQARYNGATKAQAEDIQDSDDYVKGKMSPGQKTVFEALNPTFAKQAQTLGESADILSKAKETTEGEDGKSKPRYSYGELREQYPGLTDVQFKAAVGDTYTKDIKNSIEENLDETNEKGNTLIDVIEQDYTEGIEKGNEVIKGLSAVRESRPFKDMVDQTYIDYEGAMTRTEIEDMILMAVNKRFQKS